MLSPIQASACARRRVARRWQSRCAAAPRQGAAASAGHLVEALRVARHQQQQRPRQRQRGPGLQQRRFLAFARAGHQHHRAAQRLTPGAAARQQRRVGRHVELQVAG
jgi:hypothetical protein